jgi:CMP-N,N'-diacetyllegionaminic acid synthase
MGGVIGGADRVLGVIPARGGSKGVPGKNLRIVAGRPLIAHTIQAALAVRSLLHDVVVSTDDDAIADAAAASGLPVPFRRPASLSGDTVAMVPVLQHAVQFVEERDGVGLDWILLLQPTAPTRRPEDITEAIRLARQGRSDSVISVVQVFAVHPVLMKRIENDELVPFAMEEREGTRRQDYQPPAYMRNGAIYLTRRDVLMQESSIWGRRIRPYVMPAERSVSIDDEIDLIVADRMLGRAMSESTVDKR